MNIWLRLSSHLLYKKTGGWVQRGGWEEEYMGVGGGVSLLWGWGGGAKDKTGFVGLASQRNWRIKMSRKKRGSCFAAQFLLE